MKSTTCIRKDCDVWFGAKSDGTADAKKFGVCKVYLKISIRRIKNIVEKLGADRAFCL